MYWNGPTISGTEAKADGFADERLYSLSPLKGVREPHQTGHTYCNRASIVDLKTEWMTSSFIPWAHKMRRAYSVHCRQPWTYYVETTNDLGVMDSQ